MVVKISDTESSAPVNLVYGSPSISAIGPALPLAGGIITIAGSFFGTAAVEVMVNGSLCSAVTDSIVQPTEGGSRTMCRAPAMMSSGPATVSVKIGAQATESKDALSYGENLTGLPSW